MACLFIFSILLQSCGGAIQPVQTLAITSTGLANGIVEIRYSLCLSPGVHPTWNRNSS